VYERLRAVIDDLIPEPKRANLTVLDVGGGRGELAFLFAQTFSTAMIDVDLLSVQAALRLQQHSPRHFQVFCGDCSSLPIQSKSIDIVIAKETAHHMPDPAAFFSELGRVVSDDGVVLIVEGVMSVLANSEKSRARDRMQQLGAIHHHFALADLITRLTEIFLDARIAYAQPRLIQSFLRRFKKSNRPTVTDRMDFDLLWQHMPRPLRLAALRLSGGTAILACRRTRGVPEDQAHAFVPYPSELADADPMDQGVIEAIRQVLLSHVNPPR
jgi:SAM-dependent methyltransferase